MKSLFGLIAILCISLSISCKLQNPKPKEDAKVKTGYGPGIYPAQVKDDYYYFGPKLNGEYSQIGFGKFLFNNQGPSPEVFGTLEVKIDDTRSYKVREQHYYLGHNEGKPLFGMRIIPQSANSNANAYAFQSAPTGTTPSTESAEDNLPAAAIDNFLKNGFGFSKAVDQNKNFPIFAVTNYAWPAHKMKLSDLGNVDLLRLEGGISHTGLYIGQGETRNSPRDYSPKFDIGTGRDYFGQTVHLTVLKCDACKNETTASLTDNQIEIHKNLLITTHMLGAGNPLQFPTDYKYDIMVNTSLRQVLLYYRGWLEYFGKNKELLDSDYNYLTSTEMKNSAFLPGEYNPFKEGELFAQKTFFRDVVTDPDPKNPYRSYCGDYTSLVINLGMNLNHTEEGYKEVYGNETGAALWAVAKEMWKTAITAPDLPAGQGPYERFDHNQNLEGLVATGFKPLWSLTGDDGCSASPSTPLLNGVQSNCSAVTELAIIKEDGTYTGPFVWPIATTSDIADMFIKQYANWSQTGPVVPSLVLLGLKDILSQRTGIQELKVAKMLFPIIKEFFRFATAQNGMNFSTGQPDQAKQLQYLNDQFASFNQFLQSMQMPAASPEADVILPPEVAADAGEDSPAVTPEEATFADFHANDPNLLNLENINPAQVPEPVGDATPAAQVFQLMYQGIAQEIAAGTLPSAPLDVNFLDTMRDLFMEVINPHLFKARTMEVNQSVVMEGGSSTVKAVAYYQPPASIFRAVNNILPSNPHVTLRTVATILGTDKVQGNLSDVVNYGPCETCLGNLTFLSERQREIEDHESFPFFKSDISHLTSSAIPPPTDPNEGGGEGPGGDTQALLDPEKITNIQPNASSPIVNLTLESDSNLQGLPLDNICGYSTQHPIPNMASGISYLSLGGYSTCTSNLQAVLNSALNGVAPSVKPKLKQLYQELSVHPGYLIDCGANPQANLTRCSSACQHGNFNEHDSCI